MFNFKTKILNPATGALIEKVNAALKLSDVTEKMEQLLLLREENEAVFKKLENLENYKGNVLFFALSVMTSIGLFCVAFMTSILPGALLLIPFIPGVSVLRMLGNHGRNASDTGGGRCGSPYTTNH